MSIFEIAESQDWEDGNKNHNGSSGNFGWRHKDYVHVLYSRRSLTWFLTFRIIILYIDCTEKINKINSV